MSFFNTTNEKGVQLKRYHNQALSQEEIIMCFFREAKEEFTPDEVQQAVLSDVPITSVRRAMTCLTEKGKLVKTDTKRKGIYGRDTYCWRLPE